MKKVLLTVGLCSLLLGAATLSAKETEKDSKRKTNVLIKKNQEPSQQTTKTESSSPTQTTTTPTTTTTPVLPKANESALKALAGEQIKWQVLSAGGGTGSSTNFVLSGTIGQTAAGFATSSSYQLNSGFWQTFTTGTTGCCLGFTGNVDNDPAVNDVLDISDLLYLVDFFFADPAGPAPVCYEEADVNGSTILDISDLLYLVDYFFADPAGPAPAPCI